MRRFLAVCLVTCALWSNAEARPRRAKKVATAKKASKCIETRQSADGPDLTWTFDNACDREVLCTAKWVLSCGDKPDESGAKEESVTVMANSSATVLASASACGETWQIEAPRWTCTMSVRASK